MPKLVLPDLVSIKATYSGRNFAKERVSQNVVMIFSKVESAVSFCSMLDCNLKGYIEGSEFLKTDTPMALSQKYHVKVDLPFSSTNKDIRADSILKFFERHFELPSEFQVSYSKDGVDTLVTLPIQFTDLIGKPLPQFLEVIAARQTHVEDYLSSLIKKKVKVNPIYKESTALQITCDSAAEVVSLKKRLFELAVDKGIDHLFHFGKIPGVAGATHFNTFMLHTNPGCDFCAVLNDIVAAATAKETHPVLYNLLADNPGLFDDDDAHPRNS
jgi:hypothetical protein